MNYQRHRDLEFTFIEPEGLRGQSIVASIAFHGALFAGLLLLPLFLIAPAKPIKYELTLLAPVSERPVTPSVQLMAPRLPKPKPMPAPLPAPTLEKTLPLPVPAVAEVKPVPEFKAPEIPHVDPKPSPVVTETPRFEAASVEEKKPVDRPKVVQTGGFGDANGLPAKGAQAKPANIASVGSFDLPAGEGTGNGRGGTKGVVSNSGFDSVTSGSSNASMKSRPTGTVTATSFETVRASVPQSTKQNVKPIEVPVEIVSKPRPEYTDDARRMKIEGEVSMRVLFAATGQVRVLSLVHGLGYGLDEKAFQAAQEIKFKPAACDGTPVDSTAIVRIAFQLAY